MTFTPQMSEQNTIMKIKPALEGLLLHSAAFHHVTCVVVFTNVFCSSVMHARIQLNPILTWCCVVIQSMGEAQSVHNTLQQCNAMLSNPLRSIALLLISASSFKLTAV